MEVFSEKETTTISLPRMMPQKNYNHHHHHHHHHHNFHQAIATKLEKKVEPDCCPAPALPPHYSHFSPYHHSPSEKVSSILDNMPVDGTCTFQNSSCPIPYSYLFPPHYSPHQHHHSTSFVHPVFTSIPTPYAQEQQTTSDQQLATDSRVPPQSSPEDRNNSNHFTPSSRSLPLRYKKHSHRAGGYNNGRGRGSARLRGEASFFPREPKIFVGGSLETQREWERKTACCFFQENSCRFGNSCRFVHCEKSTPGMICQFGEKCQKKHLFEAQVENVLED